MNCRYVIYITYTISVYHEFTTVFALLKLVRSTSIGLSWTIDRCATGNQSGHYPLVSQPCSGTVVWLSLQEAWILP